MSKISLKGQVALITGGSKGLGRELARALVAEGARIGLIARPSQQLDEAQAEFGDSALALPCDIRSPEAIRATIRKAADHFGRIDILLNNAAACLVNAVENVPDDDVRAEIETNLMAPIFCSREAIPYLRASGTGHIMNIGSESAIHPFPLLAVYASTKAALETFSMALRAELKPYDIRVSLLRSGHMTTSVVDQWSEEQKQAFFSAYAGSDAADTAGAPLDPATTAAMIVDILKLPKEANVRLIELGGR